MKQPTNTRLSLTRILTCLALLANVAQLSAADDRELVTEVAGLRIAEVSAPSINCVFDNDCRIFVRDSVSSFELPGTTGTARLQSRTFPVGEPGTPAEGLYAYLYRVDLMSLEATGADASCVAAIALRVGATVPLDYDGDGELEDAFVITGGAIGSVSIRGIRRLPGMIALYLDRALCAGESSFFVGVTSTQPPTTSEAMLAGPRTEIISLEARTPELTEDDLLVVERDRDDEVIVARRVPVFRRSDTNQSANVDLADAIFLFNFLYASGEAPRCMKSADVNDDGSVDLSDGVALLDFLYQGGSAPAAPFGRCGVDEADDSLGCEIYEPCRLGEVAGGRELRELE